MPQCPVGSQPAPGSPSTFWAFDFQFLNWLSTKVPELYPIISFIFSPQLIATTDFCNTEPVIPPAPSLADYVTAFTPWGNLSKILDYFRALYLSSVWPTYCQCKPGGSPAGSLEAYIASLGPANWWKYDEASSATTAVDYGTGHQSAAFFTPYALATPKICPNASGTCLTTSGGGANIDNGGSSLLNAAHQLTFVGFFQTTDTTHSALFSNYDGTNPFIRLGKDLSAGHLYTFIRDSAGAGSPVQSTNSDFHNGATHMFVLQLDFAARTWSLVSDNNRTEASGTLTANPYWDDATPMYTQDDLSSALPFGGKSQDWFILERAISSAEIGNLWFNAGLGGGPSYVPVPPVIPPQLPTTPGVPGCTTISDLCLLIQQLMAKTNYIATSVPPTGYQLGTPVTGLTGAGSIAGLNILGVIVTPTTIPAKWGRTGNIPPRYIPTLGAIQFYTADGESDWRQVHYAGQQEFASIPAVVTSIGYSLGPGVVATITPLLGYK